MVETGLLRNKPYGHTAVGKCLNCEQPLGAQHSVAQLTDAGKRSGSLESPIGYPRTPRL